MGNSNSLYVQLSKTEYRAGETLSGNLHLSMVSPKALDDVTLEIYGTEKTKVVETRTEWVKDPTKESPNNTKSVTVRIPYKEERQLFKLVIPLWNFRGGYVSGQFTFPFSVVLPSTIPGSAAITTSDASAEIFYALEGKVRARMALDLHSVQEFRVFEVPTTLPRSLQSIESQKVYTCCCFPSGLIEFQTIVASDTLRVGDSASVAAVVRNNSSRRVKAIRFQLVENREISARGHTEVEKHVVRKSDFEGQSIGEFKSQLQLLIPTVDTPVHGINCRRFYTLEIIARMSALVSNVTCTIPINIISGFVLQPVPIVQIPVVTPGLWTPQVITTTATPVFETQAVTGVVVDKTHLYHVQVVG